MSHFYNSSGESCHEIVGKNGKTRKTTIKDARENHWYPSVTTIIKDTLAAPQLDDWKQRQITEKAFCYQPEPGETPEEYHKRIKELAFEQVDNAADLGTAIHDAIESFYTGKPYDPKFEVYVAAVDKWVRDNGVVFKAHELSLVNKSAGYAGKTDACFTSPKGYGILDFKSRKTQPGKPCLPYDMQDAQIAAYHTAHYGPILDMDDKVVGVNVFISTTEPGRVEATWYSAEELRAAWTAFYHTCKVWQFLKSYTP